jgi:hypothetical protein
MDSGGCGDAAATLYLCMITAKTVVGRVVVIHAEDAVIPRTSVDEREGGEGRRKGNGKVGKEGEKGDGKRRDGSQEWNIGRDGRGGMEGRKWGRCNSSASPL